MCKRNLNYVLAYPTVKMVMVADWRLGAMRYCFMLSTLLYIIIYALWYQHGYLDIQSPDGTVVASLQRPPNADVNANQFPYCNVSNHSTPKYYPMLCEVWPEDMVLYPTYTHEHMLITTRVSEEWITMNPDCIYQTFGTGDVDCNGNISYVSKSTPKRYLAGVEQYTIEITHAMLDLKHYEMTGHEKYCLTGEQMDGKLVDFNDNEIKKFNANEPLILTLGDLLQAASTDLDTFSDANNNSGSIKEGETMRHAGIMLMVIIHYDNLYSTKNRNPEYKIQVVRIKRAEYKVVQTIQYNETYRMVRDRHGVYISFVQGGTIGKFNFQTSLIALVASLGLLGLSTFLVDMLMLYCTKHKQDYYNDKYDFTQAYANDPHLREKLSLKKRKNRNSAERNNTHKQTDDTGLLSDIMFDEPPTGRSNNDMNVDNLSTQQFYSVNNGNIPPAQSIQSSVGVINSNSDGYNNGNMYGGATNSPPQTSGPGFGQRLIQGYRDNKFNM